MRENDRPLTWITLENATRGWRLFAGLILLQVIAVPFASKGFALSRWADICREALSHAFVYADWMQPIYPVFKIIPIILITLILLKKNTYRRVFSLFVGFSFLVFAVGQNVALSEKFGLCFITVNVLMFSLVAVAWFSEARVQRNDFSVLTRSLWRYWVVPPALFAFWLPERNGAPHFDPIDLLTSGAGMGFCLMTPVYLALLCLYFPNVNLTTMRITSAVGLVIGCYQMLFTFGMAFRQAWWGGVLHLPLFVISLYALILASCQPARIRLSGTGSGR